MPLLWIWSVFISQWEGGGKWGWAGGETTENVHTHTPARNVQADRAQKVRGLEALSVNENHLEAAWKQSGAI